MGRFVLFALAFAGFAGASCLGETDLVPCTEATRYPAKDFDTASAWVTGVKWARGANKDRTSRAPTFNVRFRLADGTAREYSLGAVDFKNRFLMHRRFTPDELAVLAGATLDAFFFKGLTDEDEGVKFEDARVYKEEMKPIAVEPRARRNLAPLKGQDLGMNTGAGTLPFPVAGKDVVPSAASAKNPCALVPRFNGGSVDPLTDGVLEKTVRREGRCLIVDLYAPAGAVKAVTLGTACETSVVKRVNVPFLAYGAIDELAGGFFRYAFFDWYRSNASRLLEREINGVRTMVAEYLPKTDGTYNPVCERIVVTLSDEFADILPEIPNPPSKFKSVTGSRVWRSHASCDRARDKAFWQTLHDAGVRQMAVMDHETMWRDGGESFTFVTEAAKGKGGDAAQRDYTRFMTDTLGYVYGPYNNYTDYSPNNARWWNIDRVSRKGDGSLGEAWMRSYAPKPTAILPLCERIVPEAQAKFGFTGAYCDVHTAFPPWVRTDYDARCPGAATFSQVYYAFGELLLRQKELWNGPVWSEGGCHFMYSGLVDGNYARDGRMRFYEDPWLVDFDLCKIHPLETDFGMGSLAHFSPGKTDRERSYYLPHAPDGRETLVDLFIGATLAFGHAGYLIADWMFDPPKMFGLAYCGGGCETFDRGLAIARKSYFMTQAIAARYARETVAEIRYFDATGTALGTSEAIRTDAYRRRQLYVRYTGGVHLLVNGNRSERLRATVGGIACDLPPCGYRAWTDDGAVLVESGDANGTGPRRDHAKGPDYVYDEPAALRPAALTGAAAEIKAVNFDVVSRNRIVAKEFPSETGGLAVADYGKYAVVAILESTAGLNDAALWKTPEQCAAVRRYLDDGGSVVLTGRAASQMSDLCDEAKALVGDPRVRKVEGVIWQLRMKFAAGGKPLGVTLDRGEYVKTPEGEQVDALDAQVRDAIVAANGLDRSAEPNEWETKPLGPPGTLKLDKSLKNEASLRDRLRAHRIPQEGARDRTAREGSFRRLGEEGERAGPRRAQGVGGLQEVRPRGSDRLSLRHIRQHLPLADAPSAAVLEIVSNK